MDESVKSSEKFRDGVEFLLPAVGIVAAMGLSVFAAAATVAAPQMSSSIVPLINGSNEQGEDYPVAVISGGFEGEDIEDEGDALLEGTLAEGECAKKARSWFGKVIARKSRAHGDGAEEEIPGAAIPLTEYKRTKSVDQALSLRERLNERISQEEKKLIGIYGEEVRLMEKRRKTPSIYLETRGKLKDDIVHTRKYSQRQHVVLDKLREQSAPLDAAAADRDAMLRETTKEFDERMTVFSQQMEEAEQQMNAHRKKVAQATTAAAKAKSILPWKGAKERRLKADVAQIRKDYLESIQQYKTFLMNNPDAMSERLKTQGNEIVEKMDKCLHSVLACRRHAAETLEKLQNAYNETPRSEVVRRAKLKRVIRLTEKSTIPNATKLVLITSTQRDIARKNVAEHVVQVSKCLAVVEMGKMFGGKGYTTNAVQNPKLPGSSRDGCGPCVSRQVTVKAQIEPRPHCSSQITPRPVRSSKGKSTSRSLAAKHAKALKKKQKTLPSMSDISRSSAWQSFTSLTRQSSRDADRVPSDSEFSLGSRLSSNASLCSSGSSLAYSDRSSVGSARGLMKLRRRHSYDSGDSLIQSLSGGLAASGLGDSRYSIDSPGAA